MAHATSGPGGNRRLSAVIGAGALLPAAVLELGLKLCVALREVYAFDATDLGLEPHEREFRPENVLLTPTGDIVAGDLGLPDFGAPPKEKPIYRAPEELKGHDRTPQSDVFVVGALIWEAAVGEPLFDGPSGADAQFAVEHGVEGHLVLKDLVRALNSRIDGLGPIVDGCLKPDADDRYADPGLVGAELARLMGKTGLAPGALAKRVVMTPEARARSVSTPAAAAPKLPSRLNAKPAPPAARPAPVAPAPAPPAPAPPAPAPPRRVPPPPPLPPADVSEPEPLPPLSPVAPPGPPPEAPSWLEEQDEEGGPSVELDLGDIGRARRPDPPKVAPPPPLADAGSSFSLQAESDPESTWNRAPTIEAPPGLRQSKPDEDTHPLTGRKIEKVPLKRTQLSLKKEKEEKEETFGGAVLWFFSRILLYLTLVATIAFALAWYDVFPNASRKASLRAWEAVPSAARDAVPLHWKDAAIDLWTNRIGAGAGQGVGSVIVKVVPEDVAKSVEETIAGAEPTPTPLDAGQPEGDGIIGAVAGWAEPDAEAPPGEGFVRVDAELDGDTLNELVTIHVLAEDGTELAVGPSSTNIAVPAGPAVVKAVYSETEAAGEHSGEIRGVVVHPAHASKYRAAVSLPVGYLDTRFLVNAVDVSDQVVLKAWPKKANPSAGDPAWVAAGGAGVAVPAGHWQIVGHYDDGKHAPTSVSLDTLEVPADHGRVSRKMSMQLGEQLNPTGPGVDIEVTNFGEDVSTFTELYLYRAGSDVQNSTAVASGRGAYYFDVAPGQYELRLVFRPSNHDLDVVGEKVVSGFVVGESGVKRATIDVGFAYATLDVEVFQGEQDVSDDARVVVIGPGASFEGADRVLDADFSTPHALVVGTWDIHILVDTADGEVHHTFGMVDLKHGRVWKQSFQVNDPEWTAD